MSIMQRMKKTIRLLLLFGITMACGGRLRAAAKSLEEAITSNMWSWEYHDEGKDKSEPIRFYRDGIAKNLKYFEAHWEITGPHSLVLTMHNMKASLTFNEDFTRYDEFREKGMLGIGWGPGPGRTWKVISQTRVEFEPFTSHDWIFVVDFDPTLTKGKIVEGEFKGQTIARSESLVR